ncbi:hypothetical protein NSPZN2_11438 [Nitrospira defluvii]|uniref:Uncharacterized protein n=1 Tax=Nitrospira defluvii TaxID=330214 RepID=A0ABM8QU70_9BACT|nr:hypothetical protein NSPZN2_11438 [Nitrospira defluvii]
MPIDRMIVYFTPSILQQQGQELVELRNGRLKIPWRYRRPTRIVRPYARRAADNPRLQEGGRVRRSHAPTFLAVC